MKVLQPLQVGPLRLKNRIVRTAHGTGLAGAYNGITSDELLEYHLLRAKGGVALSILEIVTVHPSSPGRLDGLSDRIVDGYRALKDAVAPHGMLIVQQLWHGGAWANPLDGSPPLAPSEVVSPLRGTIPMAMRKEDMAAVRAGFAAAAKRCRLGGLDGVEIHMGHGFLLQQFLSPLTNLRTDDYGGSFERRLAYPLEVLEAVREAIGSDLAIGVRLSTEGVQNGLNDAENAEVVAALEASGLVDFFDLSFGGFLNFQKVIGAMHEPPGYMLQAIEKTAAAATLPVIACGRIRTLDEAEQIVSSGIADLVGMTRAHIADADLVQKTIDGHVDRVRPCIGSNQCVQTIMSPQHNLTCSVNAAIGQEAKFGDHNIRRLVGERKSVLVVGGGPAGMEAARVTALAGQRVTLVEAQANLGGMVNLARKCPRHAGIADIVFWLESEVFRAGVEVQLSTYLDESDSIWRDYDHLVIATGSLPRETLIQSRSPGSSFTLTDEGRRRTFSSVEVLYNPPPESDNATVIFDDLGHYEAVGLAELFVEKGQRTIFATSWPSFAPMLHNSNMAEPALERMHATGLLEVVYNARMVKFDGQSLLTGFYDGRSEQVIDCGNLVLVAARVSQDGLYQKLRSMELECVAIGDARAPRYIRHAILEGNRAAWKINEAAAIEAGLSTRHSYLEVS